MQIGAALLGVRYGTGFFTSEREGRSEYPQLTDNRQYYREYAQP
jgi:hypothetical protein